MSRKYLLDGSANRAKWADDVHAMNAPLAFARDWLRIRAADISSSQALVVPVNRHIGLLQRFIQMLVRVLGARDQRGAQRH